MVELTLRVFLLTMMGVTALSISSTAAAVVWLALRAGVRSVRRDTQEKTPGERRMTEAATLSGLIAAICSATIAMLAVTIYLLSFTPI